MRLERSRGIPKAGVGGVDFAMRRSDGGHLRYTVDRDALEQLAGRFLAVDQMLPVFAAQQSRIEHIVRDKLAKGALEHGRVVVRLEDCLPPGGNATRQQIVIWLSEPMLAAIDVIAAGRADKAERNAVIRELLVEALEARNTKGR